MRIIFALIFAGHAVLSGVNFVVGSYVAAAGSAFVAFTFLFIALECFEQQQLGDE